MPANQKTLRPQEMPAQLKEFPILPERFENSLPVFQGKQAYKELFRRFGIPNAAPRPGESLFGNCRSLFVDDENDGQPVAYWELIGPGRNGSPL